MLKAIRKTRIYEEVVSQVQDLVREEQAASMVQAAGIEINDEP